MAKRMPAMALAMKAMKGTKAKVGLTATGAFAAVAKCSKLKPKQVQANRFGDICVADDGSCEVATTGIGCVVGLRRDCPFRGDPDNW